METIKCILYKLILILIMLFCNTIYACSDDRIYNYYYRDYWGNFVLKNNDVNVLDGFNLLKYKCYFESNQLIKVEGYYFTGELKFIDLINCNRIQKTTYFEKDGKECLSKTYYYSELGNLLKIVISNGSIPEYDYVESFEYRDNKIYFTSSVMYGSPKNSIVYKSNGYWDINYRPLYSSVYLYNNNNIIKGTLEYFEYDSSNLLKVRKIYSYLDPNTELMRKEYFYDEYKRIKRTTEVAIVGESYTEEIFEGNIWKLNSRHGNEELVNIDIRETVAALDKIKIIKTYKPIGGGYIISAIFEDETVEREYNSKNELIKESDEINLHNGFLYLEFFGRHY